MTKSIQRVFVHIVWSTKNRAPLLDEQHDHVVESAIAAQCMRMRCDPIAIGCASDHVHVLCRLDANTTLLHLTRAVKSASAVLVNKAIGASRIRWQEGYATFSVDPSGTRPLGLYIHHQRQHHAHGTSLAIHELALHGSSVLVP